MKIANEFTVSAPSDAGSEPVDSAAATAAAEPAPIDVLELAGGAILKKYAPGRAVAALAVLLVVVVVKALRRKR
jgi:uncharacterized protein